MRGKSGALGVAAAAAFSSAALAGPCTNGALNTYTSPTGSNQGCTIGDKTFTFSPTSYSATGVTATAPANVAVVTSASPLSNIGLGFSGNFSIGTLSKTGDVRLSFKVALTAGAVKAGTLIEDAGLHFAPGAHPGGSISDAETVSSGGSKIAQVTVTVDSNTVEVPFTIGGVKGGTPAFVTSLSVTDDIALHGPQNLSAFQKDFSQTTTPEPATLSLLGVGLGALGLIGIRRRKRQ